MHEKTKSKPGKRCFKLRITIFLGRISILLVGWCKCIHKKSQRVKSRKTSAKYDLIRSYQCNILIIIIQQFQALRMQLE